MTHEERKTLIDRYAAGVGEVLASLEGFPEPSMTARPIPGKWTAREIVHHLGDSESTSGLRLRKLLTEEFPVIQGYDEAHWANALRYNERDHRAALELFAQVRLATTPLLREMTELQWARQGWHTESGLYSAEHWLEIYAGHAHGHAAQIVRLRNALAA